MKQLVLNHLTECPWRDTLYWFDSIDSTNARAKEMAQAGAPEGTVILAGHQTHGRGRIGRSFHSPEGKGIYLSVILRPNCPPDALMHLTCAAGVAVCEAIGQATGIRADIKWINDLILNKKKLGGILTELSLDTNGLVRYAIVGVGINCLHQESDFPPELQSIATSLQLAGKTPDMPLLAAAMIQNLWQIRKRLLSDKQIIMEDYRKRCITIGQPITVFRDSQQQHAIALSVDDDGGLHILTEDGCTQTVTSGEVSIRGLCGYCN